MVLLADKIAPDIINNHLMRPTLVGMELVRDKKIPPIVFAPSLVVATFGYEGSS